MPKPNSTVYLTFVRHGRFPLGQKSPRNEMETEFNASAWKEARKLSRILKDKPPPRIYSSSVLRCLQTALAIAEKSHPEVNALTRHDPFHEEDEELQKAIQVAGIESVDGLHILAAQSSEALRKTVERGGGIPASAKPFTVQDAKALSDRMRKTGDDRYAVLVSHTEVLTPLLLQIAEKPASRRTHQKRHETCRG